MQNDLIERFGIEFPIYAFTHCRDVVVAVSKAGGLGVLGAVGFSVEQLKVELDWIDGHIGDKPYAVDIVLPQKYDGDAGEMDLGKLTKDLQGMIPDEHKKFVREMLDKHDVPELPDEEELGSGLMGWNAATAVPQVDEILRHDNVVMVANALGTPPPGLVKQIQDSGRAVGALCGTPAQASRHAAAGLDFVIAQGYEGGGHTGDIGSVVLWPQVIDAVSPIPVLAAGGIGNGRQMAAALSMGAAGVWTGSLWLAVAEAAGTPAQIQSYLDATSKDTVRSRSYTGKPCRMLRNDWTESWERNDTPDTLGMPLQMMAVREAMVRSGRYPDKAQQVAFNPVGQIVGTMNKVKRSSDVIFEMVEECVDSLERTRQMMSVD
ncbi:MAG: nitronate monooxygenase family protein [Acidimicrobiales bacterium]|nr:nitronate monooxygenase family protein [Acidimicrobiales bacterium]